VKLSVLGCFGGSAAGMAPSALLLDGRVAIDAGALTGALPLERQAAIDHVVLTHSHLDHLATLPFLLDNVFGLRSSPIVVHGPAETLETLRRHVFNGALWPDFARLSNGRTTLLAYAPLQPGQVLECAGLRLLAVPMAHAGPCFGYMVSDAQLAVAVCGDTRDASAMAAVAARTPRLAAVLLEASFPDALAEVAAASGHLTSSGFLREQARFPAAVPVYVTHRKPACAEVVAQEVGAAGLARVALLEQGREYEF